MPHNTKRAMNKTDAEGAVLLQIKPSDYYYSPATREVYRLYCGKLRKLNTSHKTLTISLNNKQYSIGLARAAYSALHKVDFRRLPREVYITFNEESGLPCIVDAAARAEKAAETRKNQQTSMQELKLTVAALEEFYACEPVRLLAIINRERMRLINYSRKTYGWSLTTADIYVNMAVDKLLEKIQSGVPITYIAQWLKRTARNLHRKQCRLNNNLPEDYRETINLNDYDL